MVNFAKNNSINMLQEWKERDVGVGIEKLSPYLPCTKSIDKTDIWRNSSRILNYRGNCQGRALGVWRALCLGRERVHVEQGISVRTHYFKQVLLDKNNQHIRIRVFRNDKDRLHSLLVSEPFSNQIGLVTIISKLPLFSSWKDNF